jgi:hypothetical protein
VKQDLGFDSGDKGKITVVGVQGKDSLHASSNSNNESHDDERRRNALFHLRVVSKHTKIDTLFDPGSQVSLISEALSKKMGLETKPHPKPYPLGWVCDKEKLNVTKQWRVRFSIASKLIDEVDLDVVVRQHRYSNRGRTPSVTTHITRSKINTPMFSRGKTPTGKHPRPQPTRPLGAVY